MPMICSYPAYPAQRKYVDRRRKMKKEGSLKTNGTKVTIADDQKAIMMRATGSSYRQIAKELGVSPKGMWNRLSKPEIRKEIEELQRDFLEANLVQSAVNITKLIHDNPEGDKDKELQYKATCRVLESGGMLPSTSPTVFVNQLQQVNVFQHPKVQEVLGRFAKIMAGDEVVEVEAGEPD